MLARLLALRHRVRQFFSRGEWTVRWLELPRETVHSDKHGLVIIQIDGLSHGELQKALAAGRMPFLQQLRNREHYRLNRLYSGLPSSTPAVQGELFYRKRCAVPAFGFRDHKNKRIQRMFNPEIAGEVQSRLSHDTEGLLAGGSSYCNIYDGGAQEAHFCASSLGWGDLFRHVKPWRIFLVGSFYSFAALRTSWLLLMEFALACVDFVRGVNRREFWQELMMIPGRVVVSILMRELAINGAIMDTVRGLPIIYINLLGYDEQAHRRRPDSRFARWTLRGIDASIRRLWRQAHQSVARHYDVWILSDHGQEKTSPYLFVSGREITDSVRQAMRAVFERSSDKLSDCAERGGLTYDRQPSTRAAWLSGSWFAAKLFGENEENGNADWGNPQVAALGPLGHVYLNRKSTLDQRIAVARELVDNHDVPLALVSDEPKHRVILAVTRDGDHVLPEDAEVLFADHPFKSELCEDLIRLCFHPDAGEIVLSGWAPGKPPLTFPRQNGAHAGFGPVETNAFALLPADVPVDVRAGNFLRPEDLYDAARSFLKGSAKSTIDSSSASPRLTLRVMTYNVHACLGMDGLRSPKRIARVIAQSGADVIALQELDVARARSGHLHQVETIAHHLEMEFNFHPAWEMADEKYGDAILSRFPMRLVKCGQLPAAKTTREPRGAIWIELDLPCNQSVQVITTHLSIYPAERYLQAQAILTDGWIDEALDRGPTILLGDFNATHTSQTYQLLARRMTPVDSPEHTKNLTTWPSVKSLIGIDHIFTSIGDFRFDNVGTCSSTKASLASDHLPVVAEVTLRHPPRNRSTRNRSIGGRMLT